jgi:hypothetical protein
MEEKKKSWFRKHWILSIFLGLILLGIISTVFNNLTGNKGVSNTGSVVNLNQQTDNQTADTQVPANSGFQTGTNNIPSTTPVNANNDVWSKTSGYTLDDCLTACEKYCIQVQTDVCQSSCEMIDKEGNAMDKTVNTIKNVTINLHC